jgi:phenylacetic acid degradation operon negative regulatory protein
MVTASGRLETFRRVVLDAPVSYSVFSAFSFYGSRRGNELAGTWLVAALGALGHEVAAIRQTLYRMTRGAVLRSRAAGRNRFYRLSAGAHADAEAGLAKIMAPPAAAWDGLWTVVHLSAEGEGQSSKELVREVLRAEGFARLGPNLVVHPRDRTARVTAAARAHGVAGLLTIFRGERLLPAPDLAFVERVWDLTGIASGYHGFLRRYAAIQQRAGRFDDREAFLLRFALVFEFLETAWQDPDLPPELLPPEWPGADARELAQVLYRRLLPQALAFGDRLVAGAVSGSGET